LLLSDLLLHRVLLFLELVHVVHDDLCPVVLVLGGGEGGEVVGGREDLVANGLDG
jgi:hypothetical protein